MDKCERDIEEMSWRCLSCGVRHLKRAITPANDPHPCNLCVVCWEQWRTTPVIDLKDMFFKNWGKNGF